MASGNIWSPQGGARRPPDVLKTRFAILPSEDGASSGDGAEIPRGDIRKWTSGSGSGAASVQAKDDGGEGKGSGGEESEVHKEWLRHMSKRRKAMALEKTGLWDGDFGKYMGEKNRKLREQFSDDASDLFFRASTGLLGVPPEQLGAPRASAARLPSPCGSPLFALGGSKGEQGPEQAGNPTRCLALPEAPHPAASGSGAAQDVHEVAVLDKGPLRGASAGDTGGESQARDGGAVVPASDAGPGPRKLFSGVVIWVNGYTQPSHQELRYLMMLYGGVFENYFSTERVTHIVCSNFADTKFTQYRSKRTLPPIVTPDWVVESIKANRVLALDRFLLTRLTVDHPGQLRLTAFASQKPSLQPKPARQGLPGTSAGRERSSASLTGLEEGDAQLVVHGADSRSMGLASPVGERPSGGAQPSSELDANTRLHPELGGSQTMPFAQGHNLETVGRGGERALVHSLAHPQLNYHTAQESARRDQSRYQDQDQDQDQDRDRDQDQDRDEDQNLDAEAVPPRHVPEGGSKGPHEQAEQPRPSVAQGSSDFVGGRPQGKDGSRDVPVPASAPVPALRPCSAGTPQESETASRLDTAVPAGHPSGPARAHSTLDDPNFVQNYFKYSRLHFIGTWRNRYKPPDLDAAGAPERQPPSSGALAGVYQKGLEGAPPSGKAQQKTSTVVVHIDMDCFFVSVLVRRRPDLLGKPVAVCHSSGGAGTGTSEISSANYEARKFGVKNGMFLRDARKRCPDLVLVPYDFQGYEQVSGQVYGILHRYSSCVQALSCDEAFLELQVPDIPEQHPQQQQPPQMQQQQQEPQAFGSLDVAGVEALNQEPVHGSDQDAAGEGHQGAPVALEALSGPEAIVARMRREIEAATGCTASAGIGPNPLLARLATKKAKPNGQLYIRQSEAEAFLEPLRVSDLHGVGWVTSQKLEEQGVRTCGDLRAVAREDLQRAYGAKTGDMLWRFCRGLDDRRVSDIQGSNGLRKSIGAEVNYGVRFRKQQDVRHFLGELVGEVRTRLQAEGAKGRAVCLKVRTRHPEAPAEPAKFMGCGWCVAASRTASLGAQPTDDAARLLKVALDLYQGLNPDPVEIRGMGLQVMKLQRAGDRQGEGGAAKGGLLGFWKKERREEGKEGTEERGGAKEEEDEVEEDAREDEWLGGPETGASSGRRRARGVRAGKTDGPSPEKRRRSPGMGFERKGKKRIVKQPSGEEGTAAASGKPPPSEEGAVVEEEEVEDASSEEDEISNDVTQTVWLPAGKGERGQQKPATLLSGPRTEAQAGGGKRARGGVAEDPLLALDGQGRTAPNIEASEPGPSERPCSGAEAGAGSVGGVPEAEAMAVVPSSDDEVVGDDQAAQRNRQALPGGAPRDVPSSHLRARLGEGPSLQVERGQQQDERTRERDSRASVERHGWQLPPLAEVDLSVLEALPSELRRELEAAYCLAPGQVGSRGGQGSAGLLGVEEEGVARGGDREDSGTGTQLLEGLPPPLASEHTGHGHTGGGYTDAGQHEKAKPRLPSRSVASASSSERLSGPSQNSWERGAPGQAGAGAGEKRIGVAQASGPRGAAPPPLGKGQKRGRRAQQVHGNQQQATLEEMMVLRHQRNHSSSDARQRGPSRSSGAGHRAEAFPGRDSSASATATAPETATGVGPASEARSAAGQSQASQPSEGGGGTREKGATGEESSLSRRGRGASGSGVGGEDCTLSRRLHRLLTPSVVVEEVVEEWDGVMLSQRPPGADAPIPDLAGERASDAPRADPVEEGGTGAEVGVGSMVVLGADTEREGGEDTAGERGAETEAQAGREAGEEVAAGEDAEAEAEAGAAGKEDPEQRGTLLCEEEETCAALVPRPPLSPPLPAPAPSVAALEPDSLTQIDPAVFSELGPDLQRELRLRLPAHRRPRPPLPSVAEDAPPPAGTLAHQEPASCLGHTRNSRPPGTDPSGETGTGATLEVHRGSAVEGLGLGGEPLGSKLREGSYTFMLQQLIRGKQRRGSLLPSRGTSVRSSVAGALLRWQVSPRAEHEAEDGDSAREQAEAEECRRVVVEYAQSVVTIDLEETRLLLRALRRLAHRLPFWQVVLDAAEPSVQALVMEHYGAKLHWES